MYNSGLDYSGSGLEQMVVGSSPGSPGANHPFAGTTANYLPGFLMSDMGASPIPGNPQRLWSASGSSSPTKTMKQPNFSTPITTSPAKSLFSPAVPFTHQMPNKGYEAQTSDKPGGPPTQGLFEYMSSPKQSGGFGMVTSTPSAGFNPSRQYNVSTPVSTAAVQEPIRLSNKTLDTSQVQGLKFPPSPAQMDPFYTQRGELKSDDELDECWVTVFGFPPAAASYVLQQFYHYGNIINNKMAPNGNWMHIQYQTKLQAKIALSKNSKVLGGNIMVGVTPCIDKTLVACKHNPSTSFIDKRKSDTSLLNSTQGLTNNTSVSVAYRFASNDHSVIPTSSVPEKSTGIMSKAMEYLFGW